MVKNRPLWIMVASLFDRVNYSMILDLVRSENLDSCKLTRTLFIIKIDLNDGFIIRGYSCQKFVFRWADARRIGRTGWHFRTTKQSRMSNRSSPNRASFRACAWALKRFRAWHPHQVMKTGRVDVQPHEMGSRPYRFHLGSIIALAPFISQNLALFLESGHGTYASWFCPV